MKKNIIFCFVANNIITSGRCNEQRARCNLNFNNLIYIAVNLLFNLPLAREGGHLVPMDY